MWTQIFYDPKSIGNEIEELFSISVLYQFITCNIQQDLRQELVIEENKEFWTCINLHDSISKVVFP